MKYAIGERLTYYPKPAYEGESRHFEVEVKSITLRGRYRVEGVIVGGGHTPRHGDRAALDAPAAAARGVR